MFEEKEHGRFTYSGREYRISYLVRPDETIQVMLRDGVSGQPEANLSIVVIGDAEPAPPQLAPGEFWLKDYSENETIAKVMLSLGIIETTGKLLDLNYVSVPSARLA
jgi:hypothetical protein